MEVLLWLAMEVFGELAAWMVVPAWQGFVRRLNGPALLLLWSAAFGGMHVAWRMEASPGTAATWGRIALFIVPPVFMLMATISWRDGDAPTRPHRRNAY